MAALVASKMQAGEASAVIERLTGIKLPRATLDREARRQGQRAEQQRAQPDEQMRQTQGVEQVLPLPEQAFTLVIELDAWNIRERDDWSQSVKRWPPDKNLNGGTGSMAAPVFAWTNASKATEAGPGY
jgi:hypothetical protein